MTYSQVVQSAEARPLSKFVWPALLVASVLGAYFPTLLALIDGPWQTEQEGHGPLIMAASLWWVWQSRARLKAVEISPAPIAGWAILLCGLILLYLARIQQGLVTIEMASLLPVMVGCILLTAGWPTLRILAFPIGFLVFAVPMPDWLVDAATVPLKVFISNMVTKLLYAAGYPVAQNGVMIMIGSYQLLVKDACSGMNSIFALSAIGVFYAYAFRWEEKLRSVLLLLAIVPITILANFVRVFTLVLIAYYAGPDLLEGIVHDMTGIGLFIVAVVLMFMFDAVLGLAFGLVSRLRRRSLPEAHPHTA
ncbi:exosortase V [Bradyrhizobium guangdongense]